MEGCRRRLCSWWKTSSSSSSWSSRVLWSTLLPLMVLSGMVVLLEPGSSGYSPWASSSVFPAAPARFFRYRGFNIGSAKSFSPPVEEAAGSDLELRREVDTGGEVREKGLEVDDNTYRSSAPPPPTLAAAEVKEVVEAKGDDFIIARNRSNANPSKIEKKFSRLQILEARLQRSRAAIRDSRNGNPCYDSEYTPAGPVYWNPTTFHRSYLEMEKHLKVFVYEEGEHPIFHNGPCGSIYSMEGNFISKLETSEFRTLDPEEASVFFLPFSVTSIVHFIYDRNAADHWLPMKRTVKDYVELIAGKYPYWNRSLGSDHFMLSCHDWGPELSKSLPELQKNSIRALCNANTSEGFRPEKDVSIPEINLPGGRTSGLIGGPSASKRPILAFFAGGLHGPIRPILLERWENKDPEIQVHKYLPKNVSYSGMMRRSKYCICPSGYEVASPRMVEALYTGCVPVLVKDHYVPPFCDVLSWKSFAVEVSVGEIGRLKGILTGISQRQYIRMQRRGVVARRHFEVNLNPRRYDVFHMVLHSIWLRRLNVRVNGADDSGL